MMHKKKKDFSVCLGNKVYLFLFLFLISLSLTSATSFGYNYLNNQVTGTNGTTNNYNITNVTVNATVNTTQFDSNDPITIKESWLSSFVNTLSKWSNYWTKTENIDQTGYNITADYFKGDGSLLTNLPDGGNSSWNESHANTLYLSVNENSTIARTGNCPDGYAVQNTTTSGVECVEMSAGGSYNDSWINQTFYNKTQSDDRYLQNPTNESYMISISTDFFSNGVNANPPFTGTATSSGTSNVIASTGDFSGTIDLRDSTTANGGYRWQTPITVYYFSGNESFKGVFSIPTTSGFRNTARMYFGYHDATSITLPVDGCFFRWNGTEMAGVCRNNNANTDTATTFTPNASTFYIYQAKVNHNASSVFFEIYESNGINQVWNGTVSSNIPITSARVFGMGVGAWQSTTDAGAAIVIMDYMEFKFNYNAGTTPTRDGIHIYNVTNEYINITNLFNVTEEYINITNNSFFNVTEEYINITYNYEINGSIPEGSEGQIQFHDGGIPPTFGGTVDIIWDKVLETWSFLSDTIKVYFGSSEDIGMWFDGLNFQLKKEVGSNSGIFNISQFEKVKITNTQSSAVLEADAVNSLHNVNAQNQIQASFGFSNPFDNWLERNKGADLYNTEINNLTNELTWFIDIPDTQKNYAKKPINLLRSATNWTTFGIMTGEQEEGDRTLAFSGTINPSYELIGYSSDKPISVYNIIFTDNSSINYTYTQAIANGKLKLIRTGDDQTVTGGSHDVTVLTRENAYWIKHDGTLRNMTLPGVGGSALNSVFNTNDLIFTNGTVELSAAEACLNFFGNRWVGCYLWSDRNPQTGIWTQTAIHQSNNIYPWRGYYLTANINGLQLIVNETKISTGYNLTLNYATAENTTLLPNSITTKLSGGNFTIEGNGITDSSSYWLCTASDCSSSCQVSIKSGLIVGCI